MLTFSASRRLWTSLALIVAGLALQGCIRSDVRHLDGPTARPLSEAALLYDATEDYAMRVDYRADLDRYLISDKDGLSIGEVYPLEAPGGEHYVLQLCGDHDKDARDLEKCGYYFYYAISIDRDAAPRPRIDVLTYSSFDRVRDVIADATSVSKDETPDPESGADAMLRFFALAFEHHKANTRAITLVGLDLYDLSDPAERAAAAALVAPDILAPLTLE